MEIEKSSDVLPVNEVISQLKSCISNAVKDVAQTELCNLTPNEQLKSLQEIAENLEESLVILLRSIKVFYLFYLRLSNNFFF